MCAQGPVALLEAPVRGREAETGLVLVAVSVERAVAGRVPEERLHPGEALDVAVGLDQERGLGGGRDAAVLRRGRVAELGQPDVLGLVAEGDHRAPDLLDGRECVAGDPVRVLPVMDAVPGVGRVDAVGVGLHGDRVEVVAAARPVDGLEVGEVALGEPAQEHGRIRACRLRGRVARPQHGDVGARGGARGPEARVVRLVPDHVGVDALRSKVADHEADEVAVVGHALRSVGDLPARRPAAVDVFRRVGRGPVGDAVGDRHQNLEPGFVRAVDRVVVLGEEPLVDIALAVRLQAGPVHVRPDPADTGVAEELDLPVDVSPRLAPRHVRDHADLGGLRGRGEHECGQRGRQSRERGTKRNVHACGSADQIPYLPVLHDLEDRRKRRLP